jgi:hypothetical protein
MLNVLAMLPVRAGTIVLMVAIFSDHHEKPASG